MFSDLKDVQFFTWNCDPWFYDQIEFLTGARLFYVGFPFFFACGWVSARLSKQISFGVSLASLTQSFYNVCELFIFLNYELHNYLEACTRIYLLFPVLCMFYLLSYSTKYMWMCLRLLPNFGTSQIQRKKEREINTLSRMIKQLWWPRLLFASLTLKKRDHLNKLSFFKLKNDEDCF